MSTVRLPVPPSANNLWEVVRRKFGRKGHVKSSVKLTDRYEAWRDEAIYLVRQNIPRERIYPVAIRIVVCRGEGWSAGRDLDNCIKPTIDALVKSGRLDADDEYHVTFVSAEFGPTEKEACVYVTVKPVQSLGELWGHIWAAA